MKGFQLLSKNLKKIYFILPVFLFAVFLIFFICLTILTIWLNNNQVFNSGISLESQFKYPILKTEFIPQISAKGAIIMDADSKIVLYAKNPDLRFSPASTTKLMTALVGFDIYKPQDILTVKTKSVDGSVLGIFPNEQFTFEDLVYAMLLPSANDAALAIAENNSSGKEDFINKMNKKAKDFNLANTHYEDAAGLADEKDYTTPFDLARLASFAVGNTIIKEIVSTKEKIITDRSGVFVYPLKNLNKLLGVDGVNGVKTGFTEEAGEVLVTSKIEKGNTIIIVIMGSEDRFLDTQKLLDLINNNLSFLSIHP